MILSTKKQSPSLFISSNLASREENCPHENLIIARQPCSTTIPPSAGADSVSSVTWRSVHNFIFVRFRYDFWCKFNANNAFWSDLIDGFGFVHQVCQLTILFMNFLFNASILHFVDDMMMVLFRLFSAVDPTFYLQKDENAAADCSFARNFRGLHHGCLFEFCGKFQWFQQQT